MQQTAYRLVSLACIAFVRIFAAICSVIVFASVEYWMVLIVLFGGFTIIPPLSDIVVALEWVALGAASLWIAYKPRKFKTAATTWIFFVGYIAIALANLVLFFADGSCVDSHGNIYLNYEFEVTGPESHLPEFQSTSEFFDLPAENFICVPSVW